MSANVNALVKVKISRFNRIKNAKLHTEKEQSLSRYA